MRLIDADALKGHSFTVSDDWELHDEPVVGVAAIDAAPTVSCEECEYSWQESDSTGLYHPSRTCGDCWCGSKFERRQNE